MVKKLLSIKNEVCLPWFEFEDKKTVENVFFPHCHETEKLGTSYCQNTIFTLKSMFLIIV